MEYLKHFGENSSEYLKYRPAYPIELYDFLSHQVVDHQLAWDVGTGNGQAAYQIAHYFKKVVATDLNQPQLDVALKKDNISYQRSAADHTLLKDHSVDLITIAQALHWFPLEKFYREVKRVSKPQGIIAAWAYSLCYISKDIDYYIQKLYKDILKKYWPKERKLIDDHYRNIPFPFEKIEAPAFIIDKYYNFEQFIGYLYTWSAVKEYYQQTNHNPLEFMIQDLKKVWGSPEQQYLVRWPIHLLVGKI